jgi:hypothetical protein
MFDELNSLRVPDLILPPKLEDFSTLATERDQGLLLFEQVPKVFLDVVDSVHRLP